ncbi:hypothetical protein BKA70DRAFT_1223130 [Coprinopsis sp. MPI-PUGE-AT-0042]|nr:hypothetical protein BKA70DRAFT_1223130 [Coprinopsis sp. MPI-PUGE-AT-0042]
MSLCTFHQLEIHPGEIVTTTLTNVYTFSKNDLIVFAGDPINEPVVVAWPTINGKRVPPKDLAQHFRALGVLWGCFCCYSGKFRSCRIGFNGRGYVATCWSDEPAVRGCNFHLDLDRIYCFTKLVDEYSHLKPNTKFNRLAMDQCIQNFLSLKSFIRAHDAVTRRPPQPLLAKGWLGEHKAGMKQRRLKYGVKQHPFKPRNSIGFLLEWWIRLRRWAASVKVGIDGV